MDEPVAGPLSDGGVSFVMKPHTEEALTAETAAEQRGVRVSQIVKCMIARSEQGELVVLLIPGDKTLKLKKVRKFVGGSPLALVDPDELKVAHGLTVGAISPVQFLGKARIFMDPTVLDEELVDISSGDPLSGIELASKDLCEFLGAEVADIISTRS
jgi:Cys-tRNA(Pro)/Cys-tRNA(Cys) deacylase